MAALIATFLSAALTGLAVCLVAAEAVVALPCAAAADDFWNGSEACAVFGAEGLTAGAAELATGLATTAADGLPAAGFVA